MKLLLSMTMILAVDISGVYTQYTRVTGTRVEHAEKPPSLQKVKCSKVSIVQNGFTHKSSSIILQIQYVKHRCGCVGIKMVLYTDAKITLYAGMT